VTVNAKTENLAAVVEAHTNGLGAEVVVDAVGNQFGACIDLAGRGGKIALFGMSETAKPPVKQFDITRNELTVYGTFVGATTFPRAIQILESGAIKPSVMNTMVIPIEDVFKGIEAARRGEAVKVIIKA
jgi:threonine dehydrogenase-like Zn-dependent dehydrogenase